MRTTVRLDDSLLQQAKELATRTGRTLTSVIEDALRQMLLTPPETLDTTSGPLPTFRGGGLLPGIDLDDTAALVDAMERYP